MASGVGDVLASWHDGPGRLTTLSGTLARWSNGGTALAHNRVVAAMGAEGNLEVDWEAETSRSGDFHTVWPDKFHVRWHDVVPAPPYKYVEAAADGQRWLATYGPDLAMGSGDSEQYGFGSLLVQAPVVGLLDPIRWLPLLHLTDVDVTSQDGRDVFEVAAVPRAAEPGRFQPMHGPLAGGADRWHLRVDCQYGLLLQAESLIDERVIQIESLTNLSFGADLSSDLFDLTPPAGAAFEVYTPPSPS